MTRPDRPIAADWLALRRAADTVARDRAAWLLTEVIDRSRAATSLVVFDVGAGTGANQSYLASRLGVESTWVLLDHDADLLAAPGHGDAERVVAGIGDLDRLVAAASGPRLVTCSALLDLLTSGELDELAAVLARHRISGLFSLTVDGSLRLFPPHADDPTIIAAFNDHQSREGRPGPRAADYLAGRCRERGLRVRSAQTPWQLDPSSAALVERLLLDRADAVVEGRPDLADVAERWLAARLQSLRDGVLRVQVGHVDLLVTPTS